MVRKQVYIEERQDRALKELAEQTGRSEADLVRAAIDRITLTGLEPRTNPAAWAEIKNFIEHRAKTVSVPKRKRSWAREELHERKGFR